MSFDIIEFYTSITGELLLKILNHVWEYTDITDEEIVIILACRKSILADNRKTGAKSHVDNIDVFMSTFDSAQVDDLIGFISWTRWVVLSN